jgi:UDP-3-O-acyl-N-acetylglucosamine deacetylase
MTRRWPRRTLARDVEFEGPGLHSGRPVVVSVRPGSEGYRFTAGGETVVASPSQVTDATRCTRLGKIAVVEHILSALAGLGYTDADIELSAPELPALDGGSLTYAQAFLAAGEVEIGILEVSMFERVFFIETPIRVAIAVGTGHWRFDFDAGDRWPHSQTFETRLEPSGYLSEVAPARTFAFEEEVGPLRGAGLGLGLDQESALILGAKGFINQPKWPDEPARHKMLDLIGDLALAGVPPFLLDVVAVRSGHRANVAAAQRLATHARIERL